MSREQSIFKRENQNVQFFKKSLLLFVFKHALKETFYLPLKSLKTQNQDF